MLLLQKLAHILHNTYSPKRATRINLISSKWIVYKMICLVFNAKLVNLLLKPYHSLRPSNGIMSKYSNSIM
jgi:hypothetical protein